MKYLIFSDTHLTTEFEEKKLLFLKNIISQADKVIINGDFWEGFQITFEEFINSPWRQLFILLKNKHTIYIYGNHDERSQINSKVSLFSTKQAYQYNFKSGTKKFVVEHGHRFDLPATKITRKISKTIGFFIHKDPVINHKVEKLLFKLFGKNIHQKIFKLLNKKVKKQISSEFTDDRILVCGHTHAQELDLKHNFIATGMIRYGLGQYVLVENGRIDLKEICYD